LPTGSGDVFAVSLRRAIDDTRHAHLPSLP
jgi:hypothetical protein